MSGLELVLAAMPEEVAPLCERIGAEAREHEGLEAVWRGRCGGRELLLAATGDGATAAVRGLRTALELAGGCRRLWIVGVAGGLSPDLAAGEVVEAGRVVDPDGGETFYPAGAGSEALGTVVASERIVVDPAAKEELWRRVGEPGRTVTDLETHAWAAVAVERDLPWRAWRAVSDAADERLPVDFNRFRGPEGSIDRDRVATWVVTHPGSWRALRRLRDRVSECAEALAARLAGELEG